MRLTEQCAYDAGKHLGSAGNVVPRRQRCRALHLYEKVASTKNMHAKLDTLGIRAKL